MENKKIVTRGSWLSKREGSGRSLEREELGKESEELGKIVPLQCERSPAGGEGPPRSCGGECSKVLPPPSDGCSYASKILHFSKLQVSILSFGLEIL